jgi:flagellar basal body-associated protein FliL
MVQDKKIIIAIIVGIIVVLGAAYYLFATSGVTESDAEGTPSCGTSEAANSLSCVNRE